MQKSFKKYLVGGYVRLSVEDTKITYCDSNSIQNQKELLQKFISSQEDMELVEIYSDDGYSGSNFNRPAFQKLLKDMDNKKIDCIIVKDLSRFGRDYIEAGRYLEKIFPQKEIRFISINEGYDSLKSQNSSEQLILPFINLVNDSYIRDISQKIRTSIRIKQENGQFIAPFAPFGYTRMADNKYQLTVDEKAAEIVKRIFTMKLEGFSNTKIANILNEEGIPAPMEYKKNNSQKYCTSFQKNLRPKWYTQSIIRILKNKVYIGVLEAKKTYRVNYKNTQRKEYSEKEWIYHENAHTPIIEREVFELVQEALKTDTRTAPKQTKIYLFSGILTCSVCGKPLYRRKKKYKEQTYIYYSCCDSNTKKKKHYSIREDILTETIFYSINKQINTVITIQSLISSINLSELKQKKVDELNKILTGNKIKIKEYHVLKLRLYEDMKRNFITKEEYKNFTEIYKEEEEKLDISVCETEKKLKKLNDINKEEWLKKIDNFLSFQEIKNLNRKIILLLIKKIELIGNNKIEITFSYQDEIIPELNHMIQKGIMMEYEQNIKKTANHSESAKTNIL